MPAWWGRKSGKHKEDNHNQVLQPSSPAIQSHLGFLKSPGKKGKEKTRSFDGVLLARGSPRQSRDFSPGGGGGSVRTLPPPYLGRREDPRRPRLPMTDSQLALGRARLGHIAFTTPVKGRRCHAPRFQMPTELETSPEATYERSFHSPDSRNTGRSASGINAAIQRVQRPARTVRRDVVWAGERPIIEQTCTAAGGR